MTTIRILCMIIAFVMVRGPIHAGDASKIGARPVLESYRGGKKFRAAVGALPERTGVALILYSSPGSREKVRTMADTLNKVVRDKEAVLTWFVVDASGSPIPGPLLRHMLKRTSRKFPATTYCIDVDNKLSRRWGLPDDGAGMIVLSAGGVVLFNSNLPLTEKDFSALIETINSDY